MACVNVLAPAESQHCRREACDIARIRRDNALDALEHFHAA